MRTVSIEKKIDFMSLDVEGAELAVLSSIPWDRVDIELIMVEFNHIDEQVLDDIMNKAGYSLYKTLEIDKLYQKIR